MSNSNKVPFIVKKKLYLVKQLLSKLSRLMIFGWLSWQKKILNSKNPKIYAGRNNEKNTTPLLKRLDQGVRVGLVLIVILPWILGFSFGYPFVEFSNESIAYRFGSVARLIKENQDLTLPQGQTLSSLQKTFLWVKERVQSDNLYDNLKIFGIGTWGIMALLWLLTAICTSRFLPLASFATAICLPLMLVYGTGFAGSYYFMLPDYYQFNVYLGFLSLVIVGILASDPCLLTKSSALLIGIISGFVLGNKITNLLFLWPLVFVLGFRMITPWAIGLMLGFLSPFLILYDFNLKIIFRVFKNIIGFSSSQNGEFKFLDQTFVSFFNNYNYSAITLCCLMAAIILLSRKKLSHLPKALIFLIPPILGIILVLYKRPAGTTMWDMMIPYMVVFLSFVLLFTSPKTVWVNALSLLALVLVFFFWNSPFSDLSRWKESLISGKKNEEKKKADFISRLREANGYPLVVFIDNNDYHLEGLDELLLKAACQCPTWEIVPIGERWLHSIVPNYYLLHANGSQPVWPRIKSRCLFAWYERVDRPKLKERQPFMYEKIRQAGNPIRQTEYFGAFGEKGMTTTMYSTFIEL